MQHLKWFLLAVFATVVVEGRYIRPVREFKGSNLIDFAKFKDELKRGCRPRPGSVFCTGKRETSVDTYIPPPPLNEVFAKPKRDDLVENGDLVEDKRKCWPAGSPFCTNKNKRVATVSNPIRIDNFAKFKDEIKRVCRPRPGSNWCTGKRETLEDKETVNTDELPETIPEELSLEN